MVLERVIVPLDGSNLAEKALDLGAYVARGVRASLVLVSVTPAPLDSHAQAREAEVSDYLEGISRSIALDSGRIDPEVLYGRPAEEIARFASPRDLVVMSTHGRSGLSRLLQGSVAAEVLALAPCPVALVRPSVEVPSLPRLHSPLAATQEQAPGDHRSWDSLLGPVDGYSEQAVDLLCAFAHFARYRWSAEARLSSSVGSRR